MKFDRSNLNTTISYHTYVTEHPTLHNIGLASYNRNILTEFGKTTYNGIRGIRNDLNEYFGSFDDALKNKLLGDGVVLEILKFNKSTKKYKKATSDGVGENNIFYSPGLDGTTPHKPYDNIKDFQKDFDLYQKGFITDENKKFDINHIWSNIQNSQYGCITFEINYTVLGADQSSKIKLYFQSAGKNKTSREIGLKGKPIIIGTPLRTTGASWSYKSTQETQPGEYRLPLDSNNNNPEDTVAGELRLHYDPATGKWESGTTQMYVRLIDDLDGVVEPSMPNNVDDIELTSYYSGSFSYNFNTAYGMPMSTENGNPYLFGPNAEGCTAPKEKILLVNRTSRNYKKGELVIASLINGEWIPIGLGIPTVTTKKISPQWSQIQKYIVDAKSFFRDSNDLSKFTPDNYLQYIRTKFYTELNSIDTAYNNTSYLMALNISPLDINSYSYDDNDRLIVGGGGGIPSIIKSPSIGYFDIYDADTISTHLGGLSTYAWTGTKLKANILQTPADDAQTNDIYARTVSGSWGMYFPNGYSFASVSRFKQSNALNYQSLGLIYANGSLNIYNDNIALDISDTNLYHLPAQIALNSSGNPTLDIGKWVRTFNNSSQFPANVFQYFNQYNGDFLWTDNNNPVYALTPVNSSFVQFTPLSLNLALCGTIFRSEIGNIVQEPPSRGGFANAIQQIYSGSLRKEDGTTFLDAAFQRLYRYGAKLLNITPAGEVLGPIGFSSSLRWPPFSNTTVGTPPQQESSPDDGPNILPVDRSRQSQKEESNVVGIIGARATLSSGGGQLTLKTNNSFGLGSYSVAGGGGGEMQFTFLGSLGSWFTDTRGQAFNNKSVQWGASSNDDITAFGTTALWCKITDYKKNTIYDARFATPLQFNNNDESVDFEEPGIDGIPFYPGSTVDRTRVVESVTNSIRRNMLLSGGGFTYIQNIMGANKLDYIIDDPGKNYNEGDIVKFSQGLLPATFKVTSTTGEGGIALIELDTSLGIDAYGEFSFDAFYNPILEEEKSGVYATIETAAGQDAEIRLISGRIMEKLRKDELYESPLMMLTPSDNNGLGTIGQGYVTASKTTDFVLSGNDSGKYDIFVFFVNDILNYLENTAGWTYSPIEAYAQYVNLSISST